MSVLVAEPHHHSLTEPGPEPRHLSLVSREWHLSGLLLLLLEWGRSPHSLFSYLQLRIDLGPLCHLLFLTSPDLYLPRPPLE